jgi:hypothetical protein
MSTPTRPPREIDGKGRTIRELLAGRKYSIDYYQREYKWQQKQVAELIDDLSSKFLESIQPRVGIPRLPEAVNEEAINGRQATERPENHLRDEGICCRSERCVGCLHSIDDAENSCEQDFIRPACTDLLFPQQAKSGARSRSITPAWAV